MSSATSSSSSSSSVVVSLSTTQGITVKLESLKGSEQSIPDPLDEKCLETHTKEKEDAPPLLLTLAKHVFHKLSQKEKTKWSPTPIQLQTWPILNQGLNLMAMATTGSGKTLSYAIPMVHSCMGRGSAGDRPCVHGLVLVPTRELAIQVFKVLKVVCKSGNKLSGRNDIVPLSIYGGVDKEEQIESLLKRRDGIASKFLISTTPMRMIDILGINIGNEERSPNERVRALIERTKYFVIDEADRLGSQFDLTQQTQAILDFVKMKSSCLDQFCLFSATLPQKALSQCNEWVNLPRVTVKVNTVRVGVKLPDGDTAKEGKETDLAVDTEKAQDGSEGKEERAAKRRGPLDLSTIPAHITQTLHVCSNHKKPKKLCATIKKVRDDEKKEGSRRRKGLIIIFFGRIKTLQYMHKLLLKEGVQGVPFHSQMNQQKREEQLNLFRCGKTPILLATDIAARGLHCNNVEYIINYDFPGSLEQYVHRCGRAGRNKVSGGAGGDKKHLNAVVYSFFNRELAPMAKDVIDLLKSSNSWIDPNLIALVPGGVEGCDSKRKRRRRNKEVEQDQPDNSEDLKTAALDMGENSDDNDFASLGQNRIVLKRASHVKDDSDSE